MLLFDSTTKEVRVAGQVKLPAEIKREVEVFSATSGKTQGDLLAAAWREYRERHAGELSEGLRWAQSVLSNPGEASVQASGMESEDIKELREAFEN
jgi:hypothetical protein